MAASLFAQRKNNKQRRVALARIAASRAAA
jgi:hypothetical protein